MAERFEDPDAEPATTPEEVDRDAQRDQSEGDPKPGEPSGTPEKEPDDWVTGDEPMTAAQASYLETLSRDAGEEVPASLTKAQASRRIDELRARTDRSS